MTNFWIYKKTCEWLSNFWLYKKPREKHSYWETFNIHITNWINFNFTKKTREKHSYNLLPLIQNFVWWHSTFLDALYNLRKFTVWVRTISDKSRDPLRRSGGGGGSAAVVRWQCGGSAVVVLSCYCHASPSDGSAAVVLSCYCRASPNGSAAPRQMGSCGLAWDYFTFF